MCVVVQTYIVWRPVFSQWVKNLNTRAQHYRILLVDTFPFLTLKKMSTLIYMVELIKSFLYMLLTPNCVRLRNFELVTNAIRGKTSSSPYSYNSQTLFNLHSNNQLCITIFLNFHHILHYSISNTKFENLDQCVVVVVVCCSSASLIKRTQPTTQEQLRLRQELLCSNSTSSGSKTKPSKLYHQVAFFWRENTLPKIIVTVVYYNSNFH